MHDASMYFESEGNMQFCECRIGDESTCKNLCYQFLVHLYMPNGPG